MQAVPCHPPTGGRSLNWLEIGPLKYTGMCPLFLLNVWQLYVEVRGHIVMITAWRNRVCNIPPDWQQVGQIVLVLCWAEWGYSLCPHTAAHYLGHPARSPLHG